MPNRDQISVYAINIKEREERYDHILHEFNGKAEFDFHVLEACTHEKGTIFFWNSIVTIIQIAKKNKKDLIIICEDNHCFTENYSVELISKAIKEAQNQGAEILSGGIGGFGRAIPSGHCLYQIDWFWCTQFIVVYTSLFDKILSYTFKENDTLDGIFSGIADNKMVIYPFISEQKDFGYSDTLLNNINNRGIKTLFSQANAQFKALEIFYRTNHLDDYNKYKESFDYQVALLNQVIITLNLNQFPIGLFDGQMGICIYFFHLAKLQKNHSYKVFAEKLLENIYNTINDVSTIDFQTGITGVAWGIHYLIENKFVSGNPDHVLREVDDVLFRTIHFSWLGEKERSRIDFLGLLFYYSDRLRTIKNKEERELAQKTVIQIINHIEESFADTYWRCPATFNLREYDLVLYLLLLSKFYQLNFYNYKIVKIWDSLSSVVLSSVPTLHANRLYLLLGIQSVLKCKSIPEWESHAKLLENNINHEKIISHEFLNKQISLQRGISGYCFVLSMIDNKSLLSRFRIRMLEKIKVSNVWKERFNPLSKGLAGNIGLVNGYTGVALIYQSLLKL